MEIKYTCTIYYKQYYQIWKEEPFTKCIDGVRGHAWIIWGQAEVKLLRNALWQSNLVEPMTEV